jgi:hypothetical protein
MLFSYPQSNVRKFLPSLPCSLFLRTFIPENICWLFAVGKNREQLANVLLHKCSQKERAFDGLEREGEHVLAVRQFCRNNTTKSVPLELGFATAKKGISVNQLLLYLFVFVGSWRFCYA